MRDKVISFFHRLHYPVMLMLTVFPPALLLAGMSPDAFMHASELLALCALAVIACVCLPGRRQLIAAALCSAALLALAPQLRASLLLCAACIVTLFAALRFSRSTLHTTPPVFYLCGVLSHVLTQVILRSSSVGKGVFSRLVMPLSALSLLYLTLLLLTFNGISLDNATLGRHRLPASVRRINALLTLLFLALALMMASAPTIVSGVITLWHALRSALAYLNDLLMRLLPVAQDMGGGGVLPPTGMIPGLAPIEEPSLFAIVLERIATVLTTIVVIIGSALLIYRLFQLLKVVLRRLISRLHSYVLIVSDDYVDEVSDTREEDGEHTVNLRPRILRRAAAYEKTPAGMIRARYAQLLKKHPQWAQSSTARENLPTDSAALYERARYSEHPIAKEDADRFSAGTRRL